MKFHRYEIHGVQDKGDYATIVPDQEADFFCIYGFISAVNGGEFCIPVGDSPTRDAAKTVLGLITGQ